MRFSPLPILGKDDTIVQQPRGTNEIRKPQSRADKSAPSNRHRIVFRSIFASVVAVIGVCLIILWWHSSTHEAVRPALGTQPGVSQTSDVGGSARGPSANPDGWQVIGEEPPAPRLDGCEGREPTQYRSARNGSRMIPDIGTNGRGVLEVQNGTREDAVLALYDFAADEMVREVYVQAMHTVRMKGIPKGTYELAYTTGLDWDNDGAIFRCGDPDYAQFERNLAFTEERDQEGVQYHSITVTLHPVVGGNVRTKKISRQEFLKANHRSASRPR
jgi:hypothetical protein